VQQPTLKLSPTTETLEFPHPGRQMCRKWVGTTDDGIEVEAYVAAVRVAEPDVPAFEARFAKHLVELERPEMPGYHDPRRTRLGIDPRLVT
jgi:hypothetical protein